MKTLGRYLFLAIAMSASCSLLAAPIVLEFNGTVLTADTNSNNDNAFGLSAGDGVTVHIEYDDELLSPVNNNVLFPAVDPLFVMDFTIGGLNFTAADDDNYPIPGPVLSFIGRDFIGFFFTGSDAQGNFFTTDPDIFSGLDADGNAISGVWSMTPVPLPAGAWLLISALAGAGIFRRAAG